MGGLAGVYNSRALNASVVNKKPGLRLSVVVLLKSRLGPAAVRNKTGPRLAVV